MKDVFPEFLEPMTRTLFKSQLNCIVEKQQNVLVRRGVFSPPDSSWICHGANSTTSVAISSSMRHAFGPGIGVDRFV